MPEQSPSSDPLLILLGGPAGSGKSTLAKAWCSSRMQAAHVDLDTVRQMIVGGFADPQQPGEPQRVQFELAAKQCVSLARNFVSSGIDAVIESTFLPDEFRGTWEPLLEGLSPIVVILLPDLDTALARSRARQKSVMEEHTRAQHAACLQWAEENTLNTAGQSPEKSQQALNGRIANLGLNVEDA